MKRALISAVLVAAYGAAITAPLAPQQSNGIQNGNCILFDGANAEIQALSYNAKASPPVGSAGTQFASFALTLNYTPPQGYTVISYQWRPLYVTGQPWSLTQLMVLGAGTDKKATGCAYQPGIYYVTCAITSQNGALQNVDTLTGYCGIVGGPVAITPSIGSYSFNDPPGTLTVYTIPYHDYNDLGMPFHMQYFGYDPTGDIPANTQPERAIAAVTCPAQPPGTVYAWSVASPFAMIYDTRPTDPSITIAGMAPGGPAKVACTFSLTYTFPNGATASISKAADDTATTVNKDVTNRTVMWVNVLNSHKPSSAGVAWQKADNVTASGIYPPPPPISQPPVNGSYAGDNYGFEVCSQLGVLMPGVCVQERFITDGTIPLPPSNFRTDPDGLGWCTHGTEDLNNFGIFYPDWVRQTWPALKPSDPAWVAVSYIHQFWAATLSASSTAGILLGAFEMTMTPGANPNTFGTTKQIQKN